MQSLFHQIYESQLSADRYKNRFRRKTDPSSLIILGSVVVTISLFLIRDAAFPNGIKPQAVPSIEGGFVFGGAAVFWFITRMSRGALYCDWLLIALASVLVGAVIHGDVFLVRPSFLTAVLVALSLSGALRAWIGLCCEDKSGGIWMAASGYFGLINVPIVMGAARSDIAIEPSFFIGVDMCLFGISLLLFGAALKRAGT
jgi:uncharacterized membrane protein HdeD (DUF308 family)